MDGTLQINGYIVNPNFIAASYNLGEEEPDLALISYLWQSDMVFERIFAIPNIQVEPTASSAGFVGWLIDALDDKQFELLHFPNLPSGWVYIDKYQGKVNRVDRATVERIMMGMR